MVHDFFTKGLDGGTSWHIRKAKSIGHGLTYLDYGTNSKIAKAITKSHVQQISFRVGVICREIHALSKRRKDQWRCEGGSAKWSNENKTYSRLIHLLLEFGQVVVGSAVAFAGSARVCSPYSDCSPWAHFALFN